MHTLSKSRILAYRQCPRRLWLEIHRPELRADSEAAQARFATGHQVGEIARRLYDPEQRGILIDPQVEGFEVALARSAALLQSAQPIFEAGFRAAGALAFADVLLPIRHKRARAWRLVEVKSSTSIRDYQRDDAAVQTFVARAAGVPLAGVALAHIDSAWVYPGGGNYQGLLRETDQTDAALGRGEAVRSWIADAQRVAARSKEPRTATGRHCTEPHECGFLAYCESREPQPEHPLCWLPGPFNKTLSAHLEATGTTELREVPDALLNDQQLRVKTATLSGAVHFDRKGAARAMSGHGLPAYFLDFETVQFAVPIWKGTRPYQQIPFQFSVHRLARSGTLEHREFLDLGGKDPSRALAQALLAACGRRGPIFAYNATFETKCIRGLAERFPRLAADLSALAERMVDLLPIARGHYYHPSQHGSWSIKSVLPAICPDLHYDQLDGIRDGGMAMTGFLEAIAPETPAARKAEIRRQLRAYCALDTLALVRLWSMFTGRS